MRTDIKLTKEIVDLIRNSRKQKGYSQKQTADKTNIGINRYKRIELNELKKISLEEWMSIKDFLRIQQEIVGVDSSIRRTFRLSLENEMLLDQIMIQNHLEDKTKAMNYLFDFYRATSILNDRVEEWKSFIFAINALFYHQRTVPILRNVLREYMVDDTILKKLEKKIDDFDLETVKELERNHIYALLHTKKF